MGTCCPCVSAVANTMSLSESTTSNVLKTAVTCPGSPSAFRLNGARNAFVFISTSLDDVFMQPEHQGQRLGILPGAPYTRPCLRAGCLTPAHERFCHCLIGVARRVQDDARKRLRRHRSRAGCAKTDLQEVRPTKFMDSASTRCRSYLTFPAPVMTGVSDDPGSAPRLPTFSYRWSG